MIDFSIHQLFPDFILADKNGYAMAKAIERALQIMCETVQTGVDTVQNIDKMPEWRLDEMAWELNCLYNYNADVKSKRHWIKNAAPLYASYGTPQAIHNFLEGYFAHVRVEEGAQYAGEPFHFRVWVSGELTADKAAWANKAIEAAKNVRSIMDGMSVGSYGNIHIHGTGEVVGHVRFPLCGELLAGQWPEG